jgi:putative phage-type endonuclease
MEERLSQWLLEDRPYTKLNKRLRRFMIFCQSLHPELSWATVKREVMQAADRLMLGEVGRLWIRDRCYERVLRLYGISDQRSSAWHAKRGEMITASEVSGAFGTENARREIIMRKLEPPSDGTGPVAAPLIWGTRFEDVAKRIFEERTHCKVLDVSCVQHPRHKFLGASPDGLIVPLNDDMRRYGRLVEFKCPMSRPMTNGVPEAYWHQMQMQMECTGIDECEYVEFRFKQVNYTEWSEATLHKGSFAVYPDGRVVYDVTRSTDEYQLVYWILQSIKEEFVARDPTWLPSHLDQLTSLWDEVLAHRAAGTKPAPKEKPVLIGFDL